VEVKAKRAVGLEVDQIVVDEPGVFRGSVGGEPHHLVLPGIDLESGVIRERRIEQAEAVGKVDFLLDLELVTVADPCRGRRPLADAVKREDRSWLKRRGIESGSRMTKMVLRERKPLVPVEIRFERFQLAGEQRFEEELFAQP